MFTGIVQAVGKIVHVTDRGGDICLGIDLQDLLSSHDQGPITLGESIALNGVCLTVTKEVDGIADFDVSIETLSLTTLGQWQAGMPVNLERALLAQTRLGGHFVSGHVDGMGRLASMHDDGRSTRMTFEVPRELARFVASKGSISIDGVSLTVNSVEDAMTPDQPDLFDVNLIPHTLSVTTLGVLRSGQRVHLEVDIIARYLARLQAADERWQSS